MALRKDAGVRSCSSSASRAVVVRIGFVVVDLGSDWSSAPPACMALSEGIKSIWGMEATSMEGAVSLMGAILGRLGIGPPVSSGGAIFSRRAGAEGEMGWPTCRGWGLYADLATGSAGGFCAGFATGFGTDFGTGGGALPWGRPSASRKRRIFSSSVSAWGVRGWGREWSGASGRGGGFTSPRSSSLDFLALS